MQILHWFIANIILIKQKYFGRCLKWRQIQQRGPNLNRDLSTNFWWSINANHVKFAEECTEKDISKISLQMA